MTLPFVEEVLATKTVWSLQSSEGWCVAPSQANERMAVMPFWSSRERAAGSARDEWAGAEPTAIALAEFLESWLPGMAQDEVLAGLDWNTEGEGLEVDPLALAEALGLDLRQGTVRCAEHGEGQPAAFVCQHLAASPRTGQPAGFHCADDPEAVRPDAWCSACDEAVTANDGEWTVETEAAAGITLICGACYDRIKTLSVS